MTSRVRPDEERARRTFGRLLRVAGERPHWQRGNPRPDFWLRIRRNQFAVEVTQLQLEIRRGTYRGSQSSVDETLHRFLSRVVQRAFDDDIVHGCYSVRMAPIEEFRLAAPVIEDRLRTFFIASRSEATSGDVTLWGYAWGAKWTAKKLDPRDSIVFPSIEYFGMAPFEGDILRILRNRLSERLAVKSAKLAGVNAPRILVLIDSFGQPDDHQWTLALESLETSTWHTIVRTGGSNPARILQSLGSGWTSQASTVAGALSPRFPF